MSAEENKKLILDHYESFLHQQDAEAVQRQLAPDICDHDMPAGTPCGPQRVLKYRAMLHAAFPDIRIRIDDAIAEADRVAVRATWTGTHRGVFPLLPIPATNRTVSCTGMVFWRVCDGKIVERWASVDRLGLQQQLTSKSE